MPEGHSIHRVAAHFTDVFLHQRLDITSPQQRFTAGAELLTGHSAVRAEAYGKHFFLHFDHDLVLNVHLGMYGAWTFGSDSHAHAMSSIGAPRKIGEREVAEPSQSPGPLELPTPRPTTRVRLVAEHAYADLVGASTCRVLTSAEANEVIAGIGPDPLRSDSDPQRFIDKALKTRRPIGAVLMDQTVVGGIGNIFRAEGLFRAQQNPHAHSGSLSQAKLEEIWADQVALMKVGVRTGLIITTLPQHRPANVTLHDAWPEHANYVYQRQGRPCLVCGKDAIVMEMMQARKLYWCTTCQR